MVQTDPAFADKKPSFKPCTVEDVQQTTVQGPWKTKSDADLSVLFKFPYQFLESFLRYEPTELSHLPREFDIRGLRGYLVRDIPLGKIGGMEFHRIRNELIVGLEGRVVVECEDVYSGRKRLELDRQTGVYIPPFIIHTYHAIEQGSLFVLANTLFNPADERTHATYSQKVFRELQSRY